MEKEGNKKVELKSFASASSLRDVMSRDKEREGLWRGEKVIFLPRAVCRQSRLSEC